MNWFLICDLHEHNKFLSYLIFENILKNNFIDGEFEDIDDDDDRKI